MTRRTLNSVRLIGNLTARPSLNQTAKGVSVSNFSLVTNREWKTKAGEKKSESTFHNCLAWGKLAEICHELLDKGSLVYIAGHLTERLVKGGMGQEYSRVVIVASDMIALGDKRKDYGYEHPNRKDQ